MKGETYLEIEKKPLSALNMLDRFLFAEVMEDAVVVSSVLEIILGKEIVLKYLPQAEKEERKSPLNRFIKLDVWAFDVDDVIYDTEVQKKDTRNLPKRSRLYQGIIDSKLLAPGEVEFNALNKVFIIIIMPFDLFGQGLYKYSFQMQCDEIPGLLLEDDAYRIFLNTHGQNGDGVSPELVELLHYIENTSEETAAACKSRKIHTIQKHIEAIKASEEVGVRYMQEWEEKILDRREAKEEGLKEGLKEGLNQGIQAMIIDNIENGVSRERISQKIQKRFALTLEQAEEYMKKYAAADTR